MWCECRSCKSTVEHTVSSRGVWRRISGPKIWTTRYSCVGSSDIYPIRIKKKERVGTQNTFCSLFWRCEKRGFHVTIFFRDARSNLTFVGSSVGPPDNTPRRVSQRPRHTPTGVVWTGQRVGVLRRRVRSFWKVLRKFQQSHLWMPDSE